MPIIIIGPDGEDNSSRKDNNVDESGKDSEIDYPLPSLEIITPDNPRKQNQNPFPFQVDINPVKPRVEKILGNN